LEDAAIRKLRDQQHLEHFKEFIDGN